MSIGGVPELRANFLLHRTATLVRARRWNREFIACELSRVELNDDVCPSELNPWADSQGSALDRLISFVHIHACTSDGQSKSREFNLLRLQIVSSFAPKVMSSAAAGLCRDESQRTTACCVNFELQRMQSRSNPPTCDGEHSKSLRKSRERLRKRSSSRKSLLIRFRSFLKCSPRVFVFLISAFIIDFTAARS